ncbi:MAG: hypothetical protein HUU15_19715, partial [Candidatus Brocadiae bacterium]|nr:hypothetical protein [Candidatus Brocadiia bacterium]
MVPLAERLAPLERRLRLVEAARAATRGAIIGAVLGAGWFGVAWALRIPWAVPTALGALAAAAGAAFVYRALKPISLDVVARAADRAAGTE